MKTLKERRQLLSEKLHKVTDNVYYRTPSKGMVYPCVRYKLEGSSPQFADNVRYINPLKWSITVIDENPDSDIPEKLEEEFPRARLDRPPYISDNLNHFVYALYF